MKYVIVYVAYVFWKLKPVLYLVLSLLNSLAEPADELQKSYEQFLNRMERHKKKKIQVVRFVAYLVFLFSLSFITI